MFMLDTNMCIFIIKKKTPALLRVLKAKKNAGLTISSITLAELEYGIENSLYKEKNRVALMEFLSIIEVKLFDEDAAIEYGRIKKELKDKKCVIGPLDMLIAAHAKSLDMVLVTNNRGEFCRVENLVVEDWLDG